ncbi:MAG: glycosyltransferase family 2 protein [Clostridia bacterium]|nr:glycosyltransferase family 2 protein [Clostridia bacterium]
MPKFSVIIPIYNVEKYIRQCIDSVLNQSYTDFEVILVDDGSPDNCPTICDEYAEKDSRIRVLHKQNGGLVSARKAGANIANGEYIVCVDGDDWIEEIHLENFNSIIQEFSPDIITCRFIYAYENGMSNRTSRGRYPFGYYSKERIVNEIYPSLIHNDLVKYFPPSIWAKAYRADLYKKFQMQVDDRIKISEDSACTVPCVFYANSLYISDKATCNYRQNITSMTKDRKTLSWEGPELVHKQYMNQMDLKQMDFEAQLYRKTVHELFTVVVSQFNRNEPYRKIVKDIKTHLNSDVYSECIKKAKFKAWNGKWMTLSLRYRLFLLIKLYHAVNLAKQKRNIG